MGSKIFYCSEMSSFVFKILFIFLALADYCSRSTGDSNVEEFRQYFDIASVQTDKTTIKGHRRHVVCIINSWAYWRQGEGKYDIAKEFDGNLCTHLIYRSVLLNNESFSLKVKDNYLDLSLRYFSKSVSLKSKYPDLKILLSVGGFEEGNVTFPRIVAGRKSRKKFIRDAVNKTKEWGFDGLNLDWQFPGPGGKDLFTYLSQELKEEFKKSELILTTTISGHMEQTKHIYDIPKICKIFDLVLIMGFDNRGPWDKISGHNAPLFGGNSVSEILEYLISEAKVDPHVLILGVPLDGRPFHLETENTASLGLESRAIGGFPGPWISQSGLWGYNEICELLNSDIGRQYWRIFWDRNNLVPFTTNGSHWISFDNQDSIFAKVWMAREYDLKGIAGWSIDADDFNGKCSGVTYPLLRTINYALQINIPENPGSRWPSLCTLYNLTGNPTVLRDTKPNITYINAKNLPPYHSRSHTTEIKMQCSAQGNPRPQIRWFKSKQVKVEVFNIKQNGENTMAASGGHSEFLSSAEFNCGPHKPLNVSEENKMLDGSNIGDYCCEAENIFGIDKKWFSVAPKMEPEIDGDETEVLETKEYSHSSVPWGWIVGSFIVVVNICLVTYYFKQRSNKKKEGLTQRELKVFFRGTVNKRTRTENIYQEEAAIESIPYDSSYEIFQRDFEIDENSILGNGAFGVVFLGRVNRSTVAVKSAKQGAEKQYLVALLSELKILIYLEKHPNIVNLIGASTINLTKGLLYIFVEYCPLGNLQNYLRNKCRGYLISLIREDKWDHNLIPTDLAENMITTKDLLNWSYQVAKALEYLAVKKVIHGDLASRNVLLFEKNIVKVTDFGLSRKLYDYSNYVKNKQEPLPWRWMAIESLRDLKFSHQSDVWSFGVTIWEIFCLGETPYAGISWTTEFVDRLTDGLRIHKPKYATTSLYKFIAKCWNENPEDRPKPEDLTIYFCELLTGMFSKDYTNLDIQISED